MKKLPKIRRKNQPANLNKTTELAKTEATNSLPSKAARLIRLPSAKYSHKDQAGKITHHLLSVALPLAVYILVSIFKLNYIALGLILASKWQIFLVKPRFWWANLKFSAVDFIFKLSILSLLIQSELKIGQLINKNALALHIFQVILTAIYLLWNLYIRKRADATGMRLQALFAQTLGLIALGWASGFAVSSVPLPLVIAATWLIAYSAAQHTLYAYEEPSLPQLASFWALFSATLNFLQLIWAKNFILFNSLIYLPLIPFVLAGFGLLAANTHALIEQQQDETETSPLALNKKKAELIHQATIALAGSTFLAILIALR